MRSELSIGDLVRIVEYPKYFGVVLDVARHENYFRDSGGLVPVMKYEVLWSVVPPAFFIIDFEVSEMSWVIDNLLEACE